MVWAYMLKTSLMHQLFYKNFGEAHLDNKPNFAVYQAINNYRRRKESLATGKGGENGYTQIR